MNRNLCWKKLPPASKPNLETVRRWSSKKLWKGFREIFVVLGMFPTEYHFESCVTTERRLQPLYFLCFSMRWCDTYAMRSMLSTMMRYDHFELALTHARMYRYRTCYCSHPWHSASMAGTLCPTLASEYLLSWFPRRSEDFYRSHIHTHIFSWVDLMVLSIQLFLWLKEQGNYETIHCSQYVIYFVEQKFKHLRATSKRSFLDWDFDGYPWLLSPIKNRVIGMCTVGGSSNDEKCSSLHSMRAKLFPIILW